jgi:hypothetical protein
VPTIAVATDGGVSVIKDDGTVVDITQVDYASDQVAFTEDNRVLVHHNVGSGDAFYRVPLPTSDVTTSTSQDGFAVQEAIWSSSHQIKVISNPSNIVANGNGMFLGDAGGLHTFNEYADPKSGGGEEDANALHAITTSTYTTGWMPGDIKMAALADTTAETFGDAVSGATVSDPNGDLVYDGEHVTNGEFTEDISGWTAGATASLSVAPGAMNVSSGASANGFAYQEITTVAGKVYTFTASKTGDRGYITVGASPGNTNLGSTSSNTATVNTVTFKAIGTVAYISLFCRYAGDTTTYDNISVRLADPDRSVNGNGLAVHGSITKAAVATGADVVAYSGFSSSNYLQQPYNSDLDFGTGDFCVMGWVTYGSGGYVFERRKPDGTGNFIHIYKSGSVINARAYSTSASTVSGTVNVNDGAYHHFAYVRTGGVEYLYVDGSLDTSVTQSADDISANEQASFVGVRAGLTNPDLGSLALIRISATAPTADQIRKIYEDEKVLFQDSAKATLTGSSDAVTALAHDPDTNLLHVGTSGGRSVFQGLRRVEEHTGTNSQSLAAISAVDGLVVEGK